MTTTLKNVDRTDITTGLGVLALVIASAQRRDHLANSIESYAWNKDLGFAFEVRAAEHREHLANALGLYRPVVKVDLMHRIAGLDVDHLPVGASVRIGIVENITVMVWNA
jgi:hypothetical protein